jgi:hypothetical protein
MKTFMTCKRILLKMGNVSDESCKENQNTNLYAITFFFPKIVPFLTQSRKIR